MSLQITSESYVPPASAQRGRAAELHPTLALLHKNYEAKNGEWVTVKIDKDSKLDPWRWQWVDQANREFKPRGLRIECVTDKEAHALRGRLVAYQPAAKPEPQPETKPESERKPADADVMPSADEIKAQAAAKRAAKSRPLAVVPDAKPEA